MSRARIHSVWPTWLVLGALFATFVGERALSGAEGARTALASLAALLLSTAIAWRARELSSASPEARGPRRALFFGTLGVELGLFLYALIPLVFDGEDPSAARMRMVLWGVWPVVTAAGLLPLLAIEASVASVAFNPRYEVARVSASASRALGLALFVSVLFVGNHLADRHDAKWDLSAGHLATPGPETRAAIRDLSREVEVILFFPRASEVAETVERYFAPLTASTGKLKLKRVDHALAGELAKSTEVTENGYLVLRHDKVSDKIRLGTTAKAARSALRRLDASVLKSLVKVTTEKRVAYFTVGHGERAFDTPDKEDQRSPVKLVKRQLEAWQFTVRPLGTAEGLGAEVPSDAACVFVMGAERPFLDAELESLDRYLARGGRLFVALEGERSGDPLAGLLEPLGLQFEKTPLANLQNHAPMTRTSADRAYIFSNRFSSHESLTTMTRNASQLVALFFKAGTLKKTEAKPERVKSELVITAMEGTFQDVDGDLELDPDEKKERFGLAAVVTRTSTSARKEDEGRAFLVADADAFGDDLFGLNVGNGYLLRDAVLWLATAEDPVLPNIPEEDVRIVHKKEEDALIFYGTTAGMPGLVLLLGWLKNRRRRRS
jgi:hypothetical protein